MMKTEKAMSLEKRTLTSPIELRAENGKTVGGYAAVFNSETLIGDYFREVIAPGAFTKAIRGDVVALYHHERSRVLGRTKAGTLKLAEDDKGLKFELDLPDTTDGRDVAALIERGDITGMSFGFVVTRQKWDETTKVPLRTIEEVELHEITVTAFPAYDDTSIAMRSLEEARKEGRAKNFSAAATRLRMKAHLDLRSRGQSKA